VPHGHQVQVTYVHSPPLSIRTVELVDDSDSQSENKPERRSPNEPKETKSNWQ